MYMDVVDLREFYETPLGQMTARMIARRLKSMWPDVVGLDLVGIGYTQHCLDEISQGARRVISLMPAAQGVVHWPSERPNKTTLVLDDHLPLADSSADRILMTHTVESTESVAALMNEAWRILAPGGRLIVVVPNRHGIWARSDSTPLGHGRPYSRGQLVNLLRDRQFTMERFERALFFPPFEFRLMTRAAPAFETVMHKVWPQNSGVLIAEAVKRIYAVSGKKEPARILSPVRPPVLRPVPVQKDFPDLL